MRSDNSHDVSGPDAAKYIRMYHKQQAQQKHDNSFNVWAKMYATPYAKRLQDPYAQMRAEQALVRTPDTGVKAVAEVKKAANELVETKKLQAKVAQESEEAAKTGDIPKAKALAETEAKIAQKAKVVEGQLATRVAEGVDLAKVKRTGERAKAEVDIKKASQAKRYPHLSSIWARQDALYDRNRNQLLKKHHVEELKDAQLVAYLKTLPPGLEKEAKLERHRKQAAARRITQAHEVAKLDDVEAGKITAREKTAG